VQVISLSTPQLSTTYLLNLETCGTKKVTLLNWDFADDTESEDEDYNLSSLTLGSGSGSEVEGDDIDSPFKLTNREVLVFFFICDLKALMSLQLTDILPCHTIPRKSAKDKEAPPHCSAAIVAGDTIAKGRTSKKPSKLRKHKALDSLTSDEQDAEISK
jgi:hypothetical protein